MTFKNTDDAEAFESIAMARSEACPDTPVSAEELRDLDALRPKGLYRHTELAFVDGKLAGYWSLLEEPAFANRGELRFRIAVRPAHAGIGIEKRALNRALDLAKEARAKVVIAMERSTHPAAVEALLEKGFELTHKDVVSRLNLKDFELDSWRPEIEQVQASGVQIVCAQDLDAIDSDWPIRAYEMHIELMRCVPFVSEYTAPPFERWLDKIRNPKLHDLDLTFYAIDGDRFVGETALFRLTNLKHLYLTGLTGVVASHRRRRIALALKLEAIRKAIADGAKVISTGNEENNPIRKLNDRLGFRPWYEDLGFRRQLL